MATVAGSTEKIPGLFYDKGVRYYNVMHPEFGALADGSDDHDAIQAAIDLATTTIDGTRGGTVLLPRGTFRIGSQLQLKNRVILAGTGRTGSRLTSLAGFPVSTSMVRLGDGTGQVFGTRVENLSISVADVAGSIGISSSEAEEQCGVFHVRISDFRDTGIDYTSGCSIVGVEHCELFPSITGTPDSSIRFTNVAGQSYIKDVTTNKQSGGSTATDGFVFLSSDVHVYSCHVEDCIDGVEFGSGSSGSAIGVHGHSSVTNVIHIVSGNLENIFLAGIFLNSATNSGILDDARGSRALGGVVGSYDPRKYGSYTRLYHSAAQTLTTAVDRILTWDSSTTDVESLSDSLTKIIAKSDGRYAIVGSVTFEANASGLRYIELRKNGVAVSKVQHSNTGGSTHTIVLHDIVQLDADDYVELRAHQTSGGNLDVNAGAANTFFTAHFLGQ